MISREFGEQHRHVMHESCCTYHEKHHCVLEAVMTAVFVRFWCNTAILSGDNFCGMRVISREFGREHRHMMHEACFAHREQHHGVLSSENSPELSRYHSNKTHNIPPSGQNCSVPPNEAQKQVFMTASNINIKRKTNIADIERGRDRGRIVEIIPGRSSVPTPFSCCYDKAVTHGAARSTRKGIRALLHASSFYARNVARLYLSAVHQRE